jgi:hypothetical protein
MSPERDNNLQPSTMDTDLSSQAAETAPATPAANLQTGGAAAAVARAPENQQVQEIPVEATSLPAENSLASIEQRAEPAPTAENAAETGAA